MGPQRTAGAEAVPVFTPGDQPGQAYRIPSMIVLPGDTVLAFAESRQEAMSDLLNIDIVERRSLDGGRTWTPIQVVEDMGTQTVHSPTVVYDDATATVWLAFCTDYEQLYMTRSTDDGVTWAPARDLSTELGLAAGTYCHNGPGSGIQLADGRRVIPTNQGDPRALLSDDHGATWCLGGSMGAGEEPLVWAAVDGTVCANLRNGAGQPRIVTCSTDEGVTWQLWRLDPNLVDAGTQAAIMRDAPSGAAAGYSQIGVLSDGTILVLFETGRFDLRESITMARVDLDWLEGGPGA
jgi:sialidase-1